MGVDEREQVKLLIREAIVCLETSCKGFVGLNFVTSFCVFSFATLLLQVFFCGLGSPTFLVTWFEGNLAYLAGPDQMERFHQGCNLCTLE